MTISRFKREFLKQITRYCAIVANAAQCNVLTYIVLSTTKKVTYFLSPKRGAVW